MKVRAGCHLQKSLKKGKVRPRTGHEGPKQEQKYTSTLPLTSVLDVDGWLMPRPCRFTPPTLPGKKPSIHCIGCIEAGWAQGQSRWVWKILLPLGFDPPLQVATLTEISWPFTEVFTQLKSWFMSILNITFHD
jgi:hypothetical protein